MLLTIAAVAVMLGRSSAATPTVYGACLVASLAIFVVAVAHLVGHASPLAMTLPLGLPWIGAHFRIDALSAFFLVVVGLGGATASLFAIGYGRHEEHPSRCCRSIRRSSPA